MNAIFRMIPVILKYLINVGPLAYEAAKWGIRVVREIKLNRRKPPEVKLDSTTAPTAKPDLDPG